MVSLRVKFTFALLLTSLLAVALVGLIARWVLLGQFNDLLFQQSFRSFKTDVAAYVLTYGSLRKARETESFGNFERRRRALISGITHGTWREGKLQGKNVDETPRQIAKTKAGIPAPVRNEQDRPPFRFLLLDLDGRVLLGATKEYPRGAVLPDHLRRLAEPIVVKNQTVALAVPLKEPNLNLLDLAYLSAVKQALTYGIAGAGVLALALGLFFGNHLSANLRQLTAAIQAMRSGNLRQNVEVRSRDEVGVLASTFNQMSDDLARAHEELKLEQEKAERLLLNILPLPVAERLKKNERVIADGFSEATVLFADLVGFTEYSAGKSPQEVVSLLNEIFSCFDQLAVQHGLEKIKTMGDNYMVAAGIPLAQPQHAALIAEMALDMQREISNFSNGATRLQMRIGINTGPVVAGVIGLNKFIYDLWGDAVNIASRMESQGVPGAIQVTESTYDLLKENYLFEERGRIPVKGKGEMTAYLLLGRKPNS